MSSNSLQIHPTEKAPLSKPQKEFNRLTKRISSLRQQLADEAMRADTLLKRYHEITQPAYVSRIKSLLGLGFAMEEALSRFKLGKRQKEDVGGTIIYVLDEVFKEMEPTEEALALYNRWSDMTYQEAQEMKEEEAKESFEDFVKAMFGVDIDIDKLDDPDERARIEREIEEQEASRRHDYGGAHKQRRKSKAQEQAAERKAAKEKAEEDLKNKSVRSIYISLAKLIHPDTEADPRLRAEKEEEMKQLTQAYETDDLSTLLQMEMKWMHQQADKLNSLPDEKLNLYNAVLRDQAREMELEYWRLQHHERYDVVRRWMHMKADGAERAIKKVAKVLHAEGKDFDRVTSTLLKGSPAEAKETLMDFVRGCIDEANRDFDMKFF